MDELRGLWRGKRVNNGEWAFGCLVRSSNKTMIFVFDEKTNQMSGTEVDPSTLGECTGLRDKNGKLIFEGDICKDENSTYLIVWHMRQWQCEVIHSNCVLVLDCSFPLWQWDNCRKNGCRTLEIIGNIHDNPEMIGGDSG